MSGNLREADRAHVWHPYTAHSDSAGLRIPIMSAGEGVFLVGHEGRRFVDAISSWWASNLGHSHPELLEALKSQADRLQHSILGTMSHPAVIRLSEALCQLFPDPGRHVLFSSDGASAVEGAIKVALQYWHNVGRPEKNRLVAMEGAYHGDTLGCVSLVFNEKIHGPFRSVIAPAFKTPFPNCRSCQLDDQGNATACACTAELEGLLREQGHCTAAVVVESLCQGAGGMRMYSPNYLRRLADLCKQHDVLLICDEIAMGYGRTGAMFAHEHSGIDPDIVTVGKAITNGWLPMSAAIVRDPIYETFSDTAAGGDRTFLHGHTFAGNALAASVALKVLEIYERDNIVERAKELGVVLSRSMEGLRGANGLADVRTLGMVGALTLEDRQVSYEGATRSLVSAVQANMYGRNVLLRSLGNVLYLMMPLVTPETMVREVVDMVGTAVSECASHA